MYVFLDHFLFIFHTAFTLFALVGWLWRKTRKLHLLVILLTATSWFVFGIWKGLGYCFLTDWHWDIKRALGQQDLPRSYIKYMVDQLLGTNIAPQLAEVMAGTGLAIATLGTAVLNFLDWRKSRKPT